MLDLKKPKTRQQELKKKLTQITSTKQLQKILKSSSDQNKKLISEIRQLRDRVSIISNPQKQKQTQASTNSSQQHTTAQQIAKIKKQLKDQYAKMKQLKEQIGASQVGRVEETENRKMANLNVIAETQRSIKELGKELEDLKENYRKLEKTLESNKKEDAVNQPRIQELQEENKKLKLRIAEIRKQDYGKQHESIVVQTTVVDSKKKLKDLQTRKSMFDLKTIDILDKKEMMAAGELKKLKMQVSTLKAEVQLKEESERVQMGEKRKKINELYVSNRQNLKKMKELDSLKCKLEHQHNLWRKKWSNICRAIELHNKKIKKIPAEVQVSQFIDPKPLRRDYAGILHKNRFDDRFILKDDKTTKITGMMIFQIEKGIVTIQAFYSNGQRTQLPIPRHFLQRCRVTKIECSENDFFKLFKVKYNSIDNKITKVQIRSNKNIKYQYGEKKQWSDLMEGDTIYGFDIGVKEYPVCVFGSYNFYKGYWLLEGFGVEINELSE